MNNMQVYIHTLGCKINQYESQALKEKLHSLGNMMQTDSSLSADCIVINSCAVTSRAVQDVRKNARRFHRDNPGAFIIITGCAVKHFERELSELPGVVKILPQEEKDGLAWWVYQMYSQQAPWEQGKQASRYFPIENLAISDFPRARPVVKVQDGCSRVCTYCIVPHTRGGSRSRDPEDILLEMERLYANGFREVVISGINLSQYEFKAKKLADFWDLITWLDKELYRKYGRDLRMRLSSLDPCLLDSKGLDALIGSALICPHLHLSLQSASPDVLHRMGRSHYSGSDIEGFIQKLNKYWSVFGLGADILLGFPGESEKDFLHTYDLVQGLPFSYGHVFVFSPRPGTKACEMKPVVSRQDKKARSQSMQELFSSKKRDFLQKLQNVSRLSVVVEQEDPAMGMNEYYTLSFFPGEEVVEPKASLVEATPVSAGEQGIYVEKA